MRLAIVGGRDFTDYSLMLRIINQYFVYYELIIVSGGANGADTLAKTLALEYDLAYVEFPADWDKYGKSAGYRRNKQIVDACDMVLAFWDGQSKGTKHTIDLAIEAKKPVMIIPYGD